MNCPRHGNIYVGNVGRWDEDRGVSKQSPFESWFLKLDARAAAKVTTALTRLAGGNTSNVKSVGAGVSEYKIDFGPGYRIYFGWDGQKLVILLTGGTKKRQQNDIETAKEFWHEYKQRKKEKNGG